MTVVLELMKVPTPCSTALRMAVERACSLLGPSPVAVTVAASAVVDSNRIVADIKRIIFFILSDLPKVFFCHDSDIPMFDTGEYQRVVIV